MSRPSPALRGEGGSDPFDLNDYTMKIGISTNWNSSRHENGGAIIDEVKSLGFEALELGYNLTDSQAKDIKSIADQVDMDIDSVHVYCPVPIEAPHGYPELHLLASLDEDERVMARIMIEKSLFFAADILRSIPRDVEMRFVTASSYKGGTESTGNVDVVMENELIKGRTVLIIEDIIDTGRTMQKIHDVYLEHGAEKVYTIACLDKPARRVVEFSVDFKGFEIEDKFVVGYGMDYAEHYRTIPYVGFIEE